MLELVHLLDDALEGRGRNSGDDAARLRRQDKHLLGQFRRQWCGASRSGLRRLAAN
jgi:hypothetical protein